MFLGKHSCASISGFLRMKSCLDSQFEDIVHHGGNVRRQQECEKAGPLASTVRKQREMDAGIQLAVSIYPSYSAETLGCLHSG